MFCGKTLHDLTLQIPDMHLHCRLHQSSLNRIAFQSKVEPSISENIIDQAERVISSKRNAISNGMPFLTNQRHSRIGAACASFLVRPCLLLGLACQS